MDMKVCTKCNIEKELNSENFKPRKKSKDGFRNNCRQCFNEDHAKWTLANLQKAKQSQAKWYQKKKDHVKEVQAEY
jgi:uncharacterized membrane protein YcaP (DUF421 family)